MTPSPHIVLDLIEAFRRSKVMFTAAALGVFDRLDAGPADAATLAGGMDADAMGRLLDACVGLSLLRKVDGRYENTAVAATYLSRSSPHSLIGYVLYSDRILFRLWANLEDGVREGTNRWEQTFGFQDGDLFSNFFKTAEARRDFLMGMHGLGILTSPAIVAAFDLREFRHLVDLGGATGHLAIAAKERYPHLRSTVFDLPAAVEFARQHLPRPDVDFIPGDFFKDPLPEADLFVLGRILHDWSAGKIRALLARIYERLPGDGALLIAEKLLDDDKSGPVAAHMQSLNMLMCTEGKERTLPEYEELLREAGFARVEGARTGASLDAVLARKL